MRSSGGTNFGPPVSVVSLDELDDRLLGRAVVPGGQRVLSLRDACARQEESLRRAKAFACEYGFMDPLVRLVS